MAAVSLVVVAIDYCLLLACKYHMGCVVKRDEWRSQLVMKRAVTAAAGYGTAALRCSSGGSGRVSGTLSGRVSGTFRGERYAAALVVLAELVATGARAKLLYAVHLTVFRDAATTCVWAHTIDVLTAKGASGCTSTVRA